MSVVQAESAVAEDERGQTPVMASLRPHTHRFNGG
jgi:hypothetical protein